MRELENINTDELLKKHDKLFSEFNNFFSKTGKLFHKRMMLKLTELLELERELVLREESP